jgi:hypothetical protein
MLKSFSVTLGTGSFSYAGYKSYQDFPQPHFIRPVRTGRKKFRLFHI